MPANKHGLIKKENFMTNDYESLQPGDLVSKRLHTITEETLSIYLDAVQDQTEILQDHDGNITTPPMAVAAISLKGVIEDLKIPGGTLHVSQETSNINTVAVGAELTCEANVITNSVRGAWRFLTVELKVTADNKALVLSGKSTIMLPKN